MSVCVCVCVYFTDFHWIFFSFEAFSTAIIGHQIIGRYQSVIRCKWFVVRVFDCAGIYELPEINPNESQVWFGCINFALFLNKRTKWTFPFLLRWLSFLFVLCSALCGVCFVVVVVALLSLFIVYNIHMCADMVFIIFYICLINVSSVCRLVLVAWCSVQALWLWWIWRWIMSFAFVCNLFVSPKKNKSETNKNVMLTIMFILCMHVCVLFSFLLPFPPFYVFTHKCLIFFIVSDFIIPCIFV